MITALFNYQPKGLSKEEVIAEFENLMSWEKEEVLNELSIHMKKHQICLHNYSIEELCNELDKRGVAVYNR